MAKHKYKNWTDLQNSIKELKGSGWKGKATIEETPGGYFLTLKKKGKR